MRNVLATATLAVLAIVTIGHRGSAETSPSATARPPFELIVPYTTVSGGIRNSTHVSAYRVDPSTGALRLAAGSPFESGKDPAAVAIVPSGRFAYVIDAGSNAVSGYEIDATNGALKAVAGSPFAVGVGSNGPSAITIDRAGKYAYLAGDEGVFVFAIDASTGRLVRVAGSPFGGPSNAFGTVSVDVHPSGGFAYVLNRFNNTVSTYAIGATGALTGAGSPLLADQNSNDLSSFSIVRVDPKGAFAYVIGGRRLDLHPIDAASGALGPPAHLSLAVGNDSLTGFAIDAAGSFAYANDGGHIYAYGIDSATGFLKSVPGKPFAFHASGFPAGVTIDPSGTFAYVLDAGGPHAAPSIYGFRISRSTGALTALPHSPFTIASATIDPIARWFAAGRCAAFEGDIGADSAPLLKRDARGVVFDPVTEKTRGYFYDPASHSASYYPETDSDGTFTLRSSEPPPVGVATHDLSHLHTASGIKLGTSADQVVALLGTPKIVAGCGLRRYVYLRSREGEPTSLQFTIDRGRVTEIFEDFGG